MFDEAEHQAFGLHATGQKAYSNGFVARYI